MLMSGNWSCEIHNRFCIITRRLSRVFELLQLAIRQREIMSPPGVLYLAHVALGIVEVILKMQFSNPSFDLISWASEIALPQNPFEGKSTLVSQQLQQAITWGTRPQLVIEILTLA